MGAAVTVATVGAPAHGQSETAPGSRTLGVRSYEVWNDPARNRDVPVRIRWPDTRLRVPAGGRPVAIFSHGLGGTLAGGERWGEAWCEAGIVVLHVQHAGSDFAAVSRTASGFTDRGGLRQAASPQQLLARLQDVGFVLDEVARRHASGDSRWAEARPQAVGMSGHSFGAHTTLGMAGQRYPGHPGIVEPRLAAFVAFSPTLPARGDAAQAFERLNRPLLCLTGTHDDDVVGVGATPERRIGVFAALPPGHKAHLVLKDADHMTFAGQVGGAVEIVPRHPAARALQAQHHARLAALSTDWWRAHLLNDAQARERLGQPEGLAPGDRWQTN